MSLCIVKPGAYATVQDLGRPGHASRGVPCGGAADRLAHVLANRLVGNPDGAATIEMTLVGATVRFERACVVAIAGATATGALMHSAFEVAAETTLALGALSGGARCYLAVAGGIDVPVVLGSRATHVASGLGGLEGRALRSLDVLEIGDGCGPVPRAPRGAAIDAVLALSRRRTLRVVPGPQAGMPESGIEALLASALSVSMRSDRVGLRLEGGGLGAGRGATGEMVTEPVGPGSIQVPPDGLAIVLGPDAPVTGGYPVVASVIGADLPALGQLGPRDGVRFELVSIGAALAAFREQQAVLDDAVPPAPPMRPAGNNNRA